LIEAQNLVAYPDAGMRLAISRAVASETPRGWRITKEKQAHKIDVVIALAMAAYATVQGRNESTYNLDAFSSENFDWQGLRTYYYLASHGNLILPGGYNY
jgi:phage terminase large subunit-like protein